MKYLKLYESFETEIDKTLREICLELEDIGYNIDIDTPYDNDNIGVITIGIVEGEMDYYRIKFSDIKEYLLRIKDYLGDNYVNFLCLMHNGWKEIELNDDTDKEFDKGLWGVSIKYNNIK